MSYLVLARKYRPTNFDEVVGQSHITDLLKNAITTKRIAHAFLFSGPRGVGKTSCARILAKCLNCQNGPTLIPCDQCTACKEITQGNSFDVLEIDGASNRGIDEIRTLRENSKFAPSYGRYKIYIVDEVHMLTTEAFNALLKTLEEPPEHVKFIFATTDPNKLPPTIISRCQRFDFKRVSAKTIAEMLSSICQKEGLKIEPDAVHAIAKAAQGSFRDGLSTLDQMSALGMQGIKGEDVYAMLGVVEVELLFQLSDALGQGDCSQALKIFDNLIERGKDLKQLVKDLVEHFRNLMVIKVGGKTLGGLVDYPLAVKEMYLAQTEKFSLVEILKAIDAFLEAQDVARITESLRIPLEIAFAKITYDQKATGANTPTPIKAEKPLPPSAKPAFTSAPAKKSVPMEFIKSEKGSANVTSPFATNPTTQQAQEEESEPPIKVNKVEENRVAPTNLDVDNIKRSWDALTHAVSREKMSLATYLQEGVPLSWDGTKLTIAFAPQFAFHKESLENNVYRALVEKIFSERLKTKVVVEYKVLDQAQVKIDESTEPLVQNALKTFGGKIVSKWHNE